MQSIEQNLTQYAAYHRDRRNLLTHFAGIPMILFAIIVGLAAVSLDVGGLHLTLAAMVSIPVAIYYLLLDRPVGVAMALVLFLMCAGASELIARAGVGPALAWAALLFVLGWALQFLGHHFEGLKPAFYDDAKQLLIGPLFVCTELFFMLGAKGRLKQYIEERVGPTVARRDGRALPLTDVAHE